MTAGIREFVRALDNLNRTGWTIEFGSYDENGNVRDLFDGLYTGVDMRPGPNVDYVFNTHNPEIPDGLAKGLGKYDNVLCLDMFEHDTDPFASYQLIRRFAKPGGVIVVTAPGITFPRHDYPSDYWRFTGDGLKIVMSRGDAKDDYVSVLDTGRHIYAFGIKSQGKGVRVVQ